MRKLFTKAKTQVPLTFSAIGVDIIRLPCIP